MMMMMMMMTMMIDIYIYMDQNLYLAMNLDGSRPFLMTGKCHVWDAIALSQKSDGKIMRSVAWKKWLNSMVFGGYNYS